ncbi:hypothetical protein FA15DRAFT_699944 [Coprinopsis marcescibilis]|uniref:F-box domain-containing protein n=1 Tax=Coprinopsis marcescibilis TaxID=230819 RepID=A0A5C3LAI5_COPMA|nr:hypothetical protein FA15DRAFT_699944 [Coprinopsis marcescibilis]
MPHRVPTSGRYRISNDVLVLILEHFDPSSLFKTCQAFSRIRELVKHFHHLRYKLELALAGMTDGVLTYAKRPPMMRLQILEAYKKDWPRLNWTAEQKLSIPATAGLYKVSGDFIIYAPSNMIQLMELPSCRLNRTPTLTRHLQYDTAPQADAIVVDTSQSLIVTGHAIAGPAGQVGIRLKIRNLWKFDRHPHAPAPFYECPVQTTQPIQKMSLSVSGSRLVVTLRFSDGRAKQLLLHWRTFAAMWMEEHDVHFLNSNYLLGTKVYRGKPVIHLYNVTDPTRVFIEREYELPNHWSNAELKFMPNLASTFDTTPASRALFFADPLNRVLVLTAKQANDDQIPAQWLVINESYFRPTTRPDRRLVSWNQWANFCLVKNIPAFPVVRDPQVIGNRIVYLESDSSAHGGRAGTNRLSLIEFPPFPDPHRAAPRGVWTHIGQQSALIPNEYSKDISSNVTRGAGIESMDATEDNIVLFLEPRHGIKEVYLMTFGVPTA